MPGNRRVDADRESLEEEGFFVDSGSLMRSYLPDELESFFETETNMLGEELGSIPATRTAEVVEILSRLGFSAMRTAT
jgi:hypothetical protein